MSKKIISHLFNYAAREGAKGLTIEGEANNVALNYNFPGGEERLFGLPKKLEKNLSQALRQVLKLAPDELATKKYCKIDDKNYRLTFYLTIVPSKTGEKIIISIIPKKTQLLSLRQLGLESDYLKTIQKTLRCRSGLILISSPHGQGKSTTLYSLLKELNTPSRSLYFLGSHPEYKLDGINNLDATARNWEKVLRIDSEIIFTEINSEDDLKNATTAASTGRLVIATLTAASSWEVLSAYLKLRLPLKLKIDSLKLILNQRTNVLKTGKRDSIGLYEVLEFTPAIKKFLLEAAVNKHKEKFWEKLARVAIKEGYRPLSADKIKKTKDGLLE